MTMHYRKSTVALTSYIYRHGEVSYTDLKKYAVPMLYTSMTGLYVALRILKNRGDAIVKTELKITRNMIASVLLTPDGIRRWIINKPEDVDSGGSNSGAQANNINEYRSNKRLIRQQPIAADPDEPIADVMPCRARIAKCIHSSCYLRYKCAVHPENIL